METGVRLFEEPVDEITRKKTYIGARVRILWLAHDEWFEGTVARYHVRKDKHRVEYDDGDHEWIRMEAEKDRIQIQQEDGSWLIFTLFVPEIVTVIKNKTDEIKRIKEEQANAYKEANQWRIITDDSTPTIMFISDVTGLIRTGIHDALKWSIQDDGYGNPCFYNQESGEVVSDDPRFELYDADLAAQRNFVMQEMRYSLYFVKDLLDKYEDNVVLGKQKYANYQLKLLVKHPRAKTLAAFLIRAKGLYKPTSVLDKAIDPQLQEELDYSSWVVARLAELAPYGNEFIRVDKENKKAITDKYLKKSSAYEI